MNFLLPSWVNFQSFKKPLEAVCVREVRNTASGVRQMLVEPTSLCYNFLGVKRGMQGLSLAVQWLRLLASTTWGLGFDPWLGN